MAEIKADEFTQKLATEITSELTKLRAHREEIQASIAALEKIAGVIKTTRAVEVRAKVKSPAAKAPAANAGNVQKLKKMGGNTAGAVGDKPLSPARLAMIAEGRVRTTRAVCGTISRYHWGCRCDECRQAATEKSRTYKRKKSQEKQSGRADQVGQAGVEPGAET